MRILGEIPLRHFTPSGQPMDPDGNPDTSFLAKIPADIAWTFQTLDKNGMVLNSAQTWHQLRPGEIRTDCGGCHAHSQQPTPFAKTAAAQADYAVFDLTKGTPLLTSKKLDQSGKKWDTKDETGLRFEKNVVSVEYHRDVRPILDRSCVACHTKKAEKPAGNLVLDDDSIVKAQNPVSLGQTMEVPATYARLAADPHGKLGGPEEDSPSTVGATRRRAGASPRCSLGGACSSGRSTASASTAGKTTICRTRRRPAIRSR